MGPGFIRHMQIWWSIARIAGIWHRLKYFDTKLRPELLGYCNEDAVGLLWPMDEATLRRTARHEAFHLSLKILDGSGKWTKVDAIRHEALMLTSGIPPMAATLRFYRARGLSVRDEPLVLLADAMADGVDLADLGASSRLISLVRAITKPKPLMPFIRAATHVLAGGVMVWAIISGIIAGSQA